MVEVVGLVERALEEFLKEDVELWEIIILCNSSLYSLSGSGWKTRWKCNFYYSGEFEIEKALNWNLLTKSISLASTLPPSPPVSSLPFNMMLVILMKVILMKTTLTWIVLGNENVHEQVINREQKQNKTFALASFLYPPNI